MNPAAGHGRCAKLAPAALDSLRARGLELDVRHTDAPGDATRIARKALDAGVMRFLVVGGDGTSFEVLNGLAPRLDAIGTRGAGSPTERIALGFLPLGTGNSFLRDFGVTDAAQAIEALVRQAPRACDVVRLTHAEGNTYFINIFSLGFVADVCTLTNKRFKRLGPAGYGFGVLGTLAALHSRPLRMRLDGGPDWEQEVMFLSISNSKFTGGTMQMAPYADTADGQVDVVVCGRMSRLTLLETFPKIFQGQHVHHHAITVSRARSIELFESGPIDLMIDGEVLRQQPQRLDVLPSAIDVFV